jgi:citrate synthase
MEQTEPKRNRIFRPKQVYEGQRGRKVAAIEARG